MKLLQHQQKAVERARFCNNLALFYDVGTGKTATIVKILEEDFHKNGLANTLIFAPQSVCDQWKTEFKRFSDIHPSNILVLTGPGKERVAKLLPYIENQMPCIVVTNYEAVTIKAFYDLLLRFSPKHLVCDESQKLKSHTSVRSKKIYPIAMGATRRFLLTGTPVLNSLMDIFGQYRIMDPNVFGQNFWVFRNTYFYDANAKWASKQNYFPDWKPKKDAAELIGEMISSTSMQAKREECIDLPPLHKITIPVKLSPQQRSAYESMEKFFVAELKGATTIAPIAMTKMLRLQQIIAGFINTEGKEGKYEFFDKNPRLDAFSELLESLGEEKCIVWTTFKATYKRLEDISKDQGRTVAFLTGEQTAQEKAQSIHDFTQGSVNTLIAHPAAGGIGVNLTEAKYAIYYSKGYSLEHYLQSEARNFRSGSNVHDRVAHFHLSATDSIDEVITKALLAKKDIGETILDWAKGNRVS